MLDGGSVRRRCRSNECRRGRRPTGVTLGICVDQLECDGRVVMQRALERRHPSRLSATLLGRVGPALLVCSIVAVRRDTPRKRRLHHVGTKPEHILGNHVAAFVRTVEGLRVAADELKVRTERLDAPLDGLRAVFSREHLNQIMACDK